MITILVAICIAIWVTAAPDSLTAQARAGVAGAMSALGQSVKAGYRARRAAGKAKRTQRHLDRRAAWAKKDANGNHADPWGPVKLWLDDVFGEGGRAAAAGKAAGRALADAGATAKQGWKDGRGNAHRGVATPVKRATQKVGAKASEQLAKSQGRRNAPAQKPATFADPASPSTPQDQSTAPGKPGGTNEGNTMSQSTQALSSEAGLLPVAEALEAAVEAITQAAVAVETARALADLSFDPGEEVKQSILALIEATPDPGKLTAMTEAIPGFKSSVEDAVTHLAGA